MTTRISYIGQSQVNYDDGDVYATDGQSIQSFRGRQARLDVTPTLAYHLVRLGDLTDPEVNPQAATVITSTASRFTGPQLSPAEDDDAGIHVGYFIEMRYVIVQNGATSTLLGVGVKRYCAEFNSALSGEFWLLTLMSSETHGAPILSCNLAADDVNHTDALIVSVVSPDPRKTTCEFKLIRVAF